MIRLDQISCRASALTTNISLEEVMETELTGSFLPLCVEFFVASYSTHNRSGNFGTSLPVGTNISPNSFSAAITLIDLFELGMWCLEAGTLC
jgi:hypothetical protein